jgi:hypothetical protein
MTLTARRLAVAVGLVAAPLTLAACGLIGGRSGQSAAPVVIPSVSSSAATDSGTPPTAGAPTGSASTTSAAAQVAPTSTVTRMGLVIRTQLQNHTITVTRMITAAPVIRNVTPAPVTQLQTVTVTQPAVTITKTAVTVSKSP